MNPHLTPITQKAPDILHISQHFALSNPRILEKDSAIFQGDCDFNLNEHDVIFLVDTNEQTTLFDLYGLQMELEKLLQLRVKVLTADNLAQLLHTQIERHAYPLKNMRVV